MKNVFDGLIPRLDMTKKGISEPDDTSMETSRTEMKREKGRNEKDGTEYPRIMGQLQKV